MQRKKIILKSWQRYALLFVLIFALNIFLRWISPNAEWEDGNLLVNLVLTALLTGGFIVGDCYQRRNKKYKEKVEKLLKEDQ